MKKYIIYMVLALTTIVSCQKDPDVEIFSVGSQSLLVSLPSTDDSGESRVSFTDGESSVALGWESGDTFALYTTGGEYVVSYEYATLTSTNKALFTTVGNVALTDGEEYVAIFPAPTSGDLALSADEYRTQLKASLASQTQEGDNDKSHYNDYMLMEGSFTYSANEDNEITFGHKMAAIRLTFAVNDGVVPSKIVFDDGDAASYSLLLTDLSSSQYYTANYVILPNESGVSREVKFTMYAATSDGYDFINSIAATTEAIYSAGIQYRSELSVDDITLEIYDLEDLVLFQTMVNSGLTASCCKLMDHIDLKGSGGNQWTPIGTNDARFAGSIDGNGFTISGLYINSADSGNALVGYSDGATISNLTVEGEVSGTSNETTAALVGYAYNTTILSCSTTAATKVSGVGNNTGGIAGSALTGTVIEDCVNLAEIVGSRHVGGIVGWMDTSEINISSYENYGSISDANRIDGKTDRVGGIAGTFQGSGSITSCSSHGVITVAGANAGGIAGYNAANITDSFNYAAVNSDGEYVGGISGYNTANITDSFNYAAVNSDGEYVGGISGYNTGSGSITSCANHGEITAAEDNAGGIAGYNAAKITDCFNYAAVNSDGEYVGGIVGSNESGVIYACGNKGVIKGYERVGGIAGYGRSTSIIINCYNVANVEGMSGQSTYYVGGIAGYHYSGTVAACYNLGSITASAYPAGIAGVNGSASTTTGCYSAGTVVSSSSSTTVSALVAINYSTVSYCYVDSDLCSNSLIANNSDGSTSISCNGLTTEVMQSEALVGLLNSASYIYNSTNPTYKAYGWAYNAGGYPVLDPDVEPTQRVVSHSISTKEELMKIGSDIDFMSFDSYTLTGNIDLEGESWTPLDEFTGVFDGDGYTISGLNIDASHGSSYDYGLFKVINSGGVVKNLKVEGVIDLRSVTDIQSIGLISGYLNTGSTIDNCEVNATIKASTSKYIGGVAGYISSSSVVSNCTVEGTITASESSHIGGVVGYETSSSIINNCSSAVAITSSGEVNDSSDSRARVGGITGYTNASTIINCSNSGDIYCDFKHTGGITGRLESGAFIYNSYNTGAVYSYARAGGIIGCAVNSTMNNCYNTGAITSDTSYSILSENGHDYDNLQGGLIGETWNVQYIQNSYFLSSCVDPSKAVGMDQFTNIYINDDNSKSWVTGGYMTLTSMEADAMTGDEFVETLNTNAAAISGANTWKVNAEGYPVFSE